MYYLKVFLGYVEDPREPEGAFSWQHILFVASLMAIMVALAIVLGKIYKNSSPKEKNKTLIGAAIAIDAFEILKLVVFLTRSEDPLDSLSHNLPLFLCSIQLIAIPLAAFTKGRIKEASLDFVMIFGILGAVAGTIGAIQNYNSYAVLSLENVVSGITHTISGFASLYIMFSGTASMKKKNIWIVLSILLCFCSVAYVTNHLVDYNYMFLVRGDGTPYDILYNLVGGNAILYPIGVVALFLIYITVFYSVYYLVKPAKKCKCEEPEKVLEPIA